MVNAPASSACRSIEASWPDVRRLYWFHFFNSIALAVLANPLFFDKLFQKLGLNMGQFGLIKGIGMWVPMGLNLLAAPLINRYRVDRQVVAISYVLRTLAPFLFLVLPLFTRDPRQLTMGFLFLTILTYIFPMLGNNSLAVLCREHIPAQRLGRSMGIINVLWNLPYFLLALPMAWHVDRHGQGEVNELLWALFVVFAATAVFQIPATVFIWRLTHRPREDSSRGPRGMELASLLMPLRDRHFCRLLILLGVMAVPMAMVVSFIFPYLMNQELNLLHISVIGAVVWSVGIALLMGGGRLNDRMGGRNMLATSLVGLALAVLCLRGQSWPFIAGFAALGWLTNAGIFGAGAMLGQQWLTMRLSNPERSNVYFAMAAFATACGGLIGATAGGWLLEAWCRPEAPLAHYPLYFTLCAGLFVAVSPLVWWVQDGHRPAYPWRMVWATMTGIFTSLYALGGPWKRR